MKVLRVFDNQGQCPGKRITPRTTMARMPIGPAAPRAARSVAPSTEQHRSRHDHNKATPARRRRPACTATPLRLSGWLLQSALAIGPEHSAGMGGTTRSHLDRQQVSTIGA